MANYSHPTPPARAYSYGRNAMPAAQSIQSSTFGNYLLRPGILDVELWEPNYEQPTTFRPWPAVSLEDPSQFDPYRWNAEPGMFGGWVAGYPAVRGFGVQGVTMLLSDCSDPDYDAHLRDRDPAWILYRAIADAKRDSIRAPGSHEWPALLDKRPNRPAALPKPGFYHFLQGCLVRGGNGPYDRELKKKRTVVYDPTAPYYGAAPEDPSILVGLYNSSGYAVMNLFEDRVEDWKGDPDDPAQFINGDPVGIDEGRFIHVYNEDKDWSFKAASHTATPAAVSGFGGSRGSAARRGLNSGRSGGVAGYTAVATATLDGTPEGTSARLTGNEDLVRAKWKHWSRILRFPTELERAHIIARECKFPLHALQYAWREHPDWIPREVVEAAAHPVTAAATDGRTSAEDYARMTAARPAPSLPTSSPVAPAAGFGGSRTTARPELDPATPTPPSAAGSLPPTSVPSAPASLEEAQRNMDQRKEELKRRMDEARAKRQAQLSAMPQD